MNDLRLRFLHENRRRSVEDLLKLAKVLVTTNEALRQTEEPGVVTIMPPTD